MEPLKEKIVLELDASGVKGNSLSGLIAQLEQVEARVQQVNAALSGARVGSGAARSVNELQAAIQKLQGKGAGLKAGELAKGLDLDQREFERFLARRKASLKDYYSTQQEFRSAPAAARAVARFEREGAVGRARLGDLLRPTVQSTVQSPQSANVSGNVLLTIPAAQVQASVSGPIQLNIAGSQIQGSGSGVEGRNPETGQFTGKAKGGKRKAEKGPLDLPDQTGELQRVRVETDKQLKETITAVNEAGEIVATTHDSIEGIVRTSKKRVTGAKPIDLFRQARRAAEENFKQLKAAIDPNDPGLGLAQLQKKQAEQLRALLTQPFMEKLAPPQREAITQQIEQQARTLEAKGIETFRSAIFRQQNARTGGFRQYTMASVQVRLGTQPTLPATPTFPPSFYARTKPAPQYRNYGITPARYAQNSALQPVVPAMPAWMTNPAFTTKYSGPVPPKIPPPAKPPVSPFARGLKSFTPTGFAANLLNVSGWAASVGVLYKSVELAEYSLKRLVDVGQQTARLSVVFRGVGGDAKQLTDDILQLAAANGRDTEEAMTSATEWSRLGLSRKQVNEAVRVSMEAANVADMHAGETTKQLMSLMHIYNLEVGDLSGVLGMLTSTSQHYNVTLEDLFQGLDRAAGAGKLAKVPLAELQAFIGTVVGKTGQSGTVVGNTLKSMFVQFSNPDVQQYLRRFGVETLTKEGGQKSGSQILQEMFVRWQSLDDRNKQSLTWRLVGRQNAARFVPVMDDYLQSQKMAIESQLNLNSAQEANARILGTLKSQLAGLRAEWDRLVVTQGNAAGLAGASPMEVATGGARTGKNLLKLFNKSGINLSSIAAETMGGLIPGLGNAATDINRSGAIGRLLKAFNVVMDGPPGPRDRQMDFLQHMQGLNSQAGALAMRGRLMETIAAVLPSAKGGSLKSMLEVASSQLEDHGAALRSAVSGGNITGAQDLLRAAGKSASAASLQKAGEALSERTNRLADLNLSLQNVQGEVGALQEKKASQAALNQKLQEQKELETEIAELESDRSAAADAYAREAAEVADVVEMKQQYLNLLKEQEMLMESIGQLSEQQTLGTAGSRLDAQVSGLATTIEMLKAQKDALDERGGAEDVQASEQLRRQIAEAEARKAAMESPQVRATTDRFDQRQIAARRAREEADSYAVGYTEGEKLLTQQRELERTITRINGQPSRSDNDRVRIKELEIALWQNQEKIQQRIVELSRQEKQIRIDATREFQKNLLLAGPGEQLQRLYVANLATRKIGSGEFNALSPDLKRMYYDLMGGEAGAKTREERNLLGRGQTVEQEQAAYARARGRVSFSGGILDRNIAGQVGKLPAMPLPALDPLVTTARAASTQLGVLSGSANRAAQALNQLPETIQAMAQDAVQQALPKGGGAATPKLDVQSGFALGASGSGNAGGNSPDWYRKQYGGGFSKGRGWHYNGDVSGGWSWDDGQ